MSRKLITISFALVVPILFMLAFYTMNSTQFMWYYAFILLWSITYPSYLLWGLQLGRQTKIFFGTLLCLLNIVYFGTSGATLVDSIEDSIETNTSSDLSFFTYLFLSIFPLLLILVFHFLIAGNTKHKVALLSCYVLFYIALLFLKIGYVAANLAF